MTFNKRICGKLFAALQFAANAGVKAKGRACLKFTSGKQS